VAGRVHNYAPGAGVQSDAWNAADWWLS
jgi:hypothetical protein